MMTKMAKKDAAQNEPVLQLAHAPSVSSLSSSVPVILCKKWKTIFSSEMENNIQ
jgi:hypothetical protein